MFIKEFVLDDKPRERAKAIGFNNLTTIELIALIIRSGARKQSVLDISQTILYESKSLSELKSWSVHDLNSIYGMGDAKSIALLAALELASRFNSREITSETFVVKNPDSAFKYMGKYSFNTKQEEFYIICLNSRKEVLSSKMLFKGTIDSSIVHPREIFRYIIEEGSSFVIFAHNHPSRNLTPSIEDVEVTRRLMECGQIFNVKVLDHIVFSDIGYCSMKELNLI